MRVGIVTDSTASLAPADAQREGIIVVPLQVCIDDDTFTEGVDLSAAAIADALTAGRQVTTSRPSPRAFEQAYAELVEHGVEQIASIHLSAEVSGTAESARQAAASCAVPVRVVDTRTVGIATGLAAGRAAAAARDGADASKAAQAATASAAASTVLLYVDSLEYLKRGGRVGLTSAWIGSVLAVKPLLTLDDGHVVAMEKIRTTSKALSRVDELIVERARACPDGFQIGIQHLANHDRSQQLADSLASQLNLAAVPVDEVGAVIGAHVGPGTIAVTLCPYP